MNFFLTLIPNILSALRLALACIFPFAPQGLWIWLILSSGATDFLDGWCARRWKTTSWQGGLLDAVADKMFMLSALLTFSLAGKFPAWWIPAVIARDLTVAIAAGYAAAIGSWDSFQKMNVRWSGKLATAGQFILLIIVALFPSAIPIVLLLTVLGSGIAAGDYGHLFYQALQQRKQAR